MFTSEGNRLMQIVCIEHSMRWRKGLITLTELGGENKITLWIGRFPISPIISLPGHQAWNIVVGSTPLNCEDEIVARIQFDESIYQSIKININKINLLSIYFFVFSNLFNKLYFKTDSHFLPLSSFLINTSLNLLNI